MATLESRIPVTFQERLVGQTFALKGLDLWQHSTPVDVTAFCA